MRLLANLNLNYLRVFLAVYRAKSMTIAAKELHLTQSGISQQIKSLEEILNVCLFERINRKLIPTSDADILARYCSTGLNALETAVLEISDIGTTLSGTIKLGFPQEFGLNVVLPKVVASFNASHPFVAFEFRIGLASEMHQLLADGIIDLAFLDSIASDPRVSTQEVFEETLELCALSSRFPVTGNLTLESFKKLPVIAYLPGGPLVKQWIRHNFDTTPGELSVVATVMDSQCVAKMVGLGMGAGILPGYLVGNLKKRNPRVATFKGRSPLINRISLGYLTGRRFSKLQEAFCEHVRQSLS